MLGAIVAQLVPTVIALAIYFCFADIVLILQCLYYRNTIPSFFTSNNKQADDEACHEPLLGRRRSSVKSSSSKRNASASAQARRCQSSEPFLTITKPLHHLNRSWVVNIMSIVAISGLGLAGWALVWQLGLWQPTEQDSGRSSTQPLNAMVLGYISALCYLGYVDSSTIWLHSCLAFISARLPQIFKNFRNKSCEG